MPSTLHPLLHTDVSERNLVFALDQEPTVVVITVHNHSDRFAAFQLELQAPGIDPARGPEWYRLRPAISSKIPSGDATRFRLEIFAPPPVAGGFSGVMALKARISSPDLPDTERSEDLRLTVSGSSLQPPEIILEAESFTLRPQSDQPTPIQLRVHVRNPNRKILTTTLYLRGLDPTWTPSGNPQSLTLDPDQRRTLHFTIQVPPIPQAPSGNYSLSLTAEQPTAPTASAPLFLHLLPAGFLQLQLPQAQFQLPDPAYRWLNPRRVSVQVQLQLLNASNLTPIADLQLHPALPSRFSPFSISSAPVSTSDARRPTSNVPSWSPYLPTWLRQRLTPRRPDTIDVDKLQKIAAPLAELTTAPLPLNQTSSTQFTLERQLPWLGWGRRERLEAIASVPTNALEVREPVQTVTLEILPVIPLRWQLLGLVTLVLLAVLAQGLEQGHRGPVNAVRFNGVGSEVISASDDQTLRRWRVQGRGLKPAGVLINLKRAVRTVRYRPVNNDEWGIALENGEVLGLNRMNGRSQRLPTALDDRAFDLVFSRDARLLYSGHGSGLIQVHPLGPTPTPGLMANGAGEKGMTIATGFAVRALALVGSGDRYLAVGGRYNQLKLLDRGLLGGSAPALSLPYPDGGSEAYIMSLATAQDAPQLLAVADNQGQLSLWDVQRCGTPQATNLPCEPLALWSGHGTSPIYSIALSADACYLASAAADGQVKLWPLTAQGRRRPEPANGDVVFQSRSPFKAVDLLRDRDRLWIVAGNDNHRVRLTTRSIRRSLAPDSSTSPGGCEP